MHFYVIFDQFPRVNYGSKIIVRKLIAQGFQKWSYKQFTRLGKSISICTVQILASQKIAQKACKYSELKFVVLNKNENKNTVFLLSMFFSLIL